MQQHVNNHATNQSQAIEFIDRAIFLSSERTHFKKVNDYFKDLKLLHSEKLWNELSQKIELLLLHSSRDEIMKSFPVELSAQSSKEIEMMNEILVNLYLNFISSFEERLNALKLARIAVHTAERCETRERAIEFLELVLVKTRQTKQTQFEEAEVFVRMNIALLNLHGGDSEKAKEEVNKSHQKEDLFLWKQADPTVSAAFHYLAAQLYKHERDFANFYKSGILYLAYVDCMTLGEDVAQELAVDLALAALLGENVFNFAEFLAHPISKFISKESKSEFGWLLDMVQVFNDGDLNAYDELCEKYADQLNAQPALVMHERKLREKITILAFLRIVFELPAEKREIELADIAVRTKLSVDGVEFLLMKTLSAGLIEGEIDEVSSKVVVTWAQPRILLKPEIQELADRLDQWIQKVSETTTSLQQELLMSSA
jgi:26S proteasome regulatory subunit N9